MSQNRAAVQKLISVEYGIIRELQTHFHFSHANYLRWLAPLLIIEPVLLYLDSDLIVQCDIESLFALARGDKIVGGVEDLRGGSIRREELGLKAGDPYLNTGVLLINSERWRACQISQKAIRFAKEFKGPLWGVDQDALNCVVELEKFVIDPKWNVQTFTLGYYGLGQRFDADRFEGIFHFSGEVKPWMRWADPWGQKFYMKYASVLGIPSNFWREPKTVGQRLLQARAADEEHDYARANEIRRGILTFMVNNDDGTLWGRAYE